MQYHELSAADLAKFREATKPVYGAMRKKLGDKVSPELKDALKGLFSR